MHRGQQEGQPEDTIDRKSWPWWKVQKWVLNILHRLYTRYSGPKGQHSKGSNEQQFGEMWHSVCSQQFLEDHMAIAARLTQARFQRRRCCNHQWKLLADVPTSSDFDYQSEALRC